MINTFKKDQRNLKKKKLYSCCSQSNTRTQNRRFLLQHLFKMSNLCINSCSKPDLRFLSSF
ncbi:hypothetical protein HanPSC8_Chr04g0136061 [Helianthus annuus]|nr:hypothetical protein HanPSC8_Chr04g0136061 [Helianthus annuus]